jgi:hypothetical protein
MSWIKETTTMQSPSNNVREPKSETAQNKDTYRAPRLVTLGTAESLVQGSCLGNVLDTSSPTCNKYQVRRIAVR